MSKPRFSLRGALIDGCLRAVGAQSREEILARLLRQRAAASQAGLEAQEKMLREQIRWSLPVRRPRPPDA